jgi:hypothetical protein
MIHILYKKKEETEYNEKYKPVRIHPRFTLPFELTDIWNGITFLVQTVRYDSYYIEFTASNDEMNDITDIYNSDNLIIRDNTQNIEIIGDRTAQDSFIFNEPEPIGLGNTWKVSFIVKTNRQVNTKALPNSNTHELICTYDDGVSPVIKNFYTDYDIFTETKDTEQESTTDKDEVNILDYALTQRIIKSVFYLEPTDAADLKEFYEKSQSITIDGVTVLQNGIATSEPYGEDLYKIQLECLISSETSFPSAV